MIYPILKAHIGTDLGLDEDEMLSFLYDIERTTHSESSFKFCQGKGYEA